VHGKSDHKTFNCSVLGVATYVKDKGIDVKQHASMHGGWYYLLYEYIPKMSKEGNNRYDEWKKLYSSGHHKFDPISKNEETTTREYQPAKKRIERKKEDSKQIDLQMALKMQREGIPEDVIWRLMKGDSTNYETNNNDSLTVET